MHTRIPARALLIGALSLSFASGCGEPSHLIRVTGRVVKGGEKYTPPPDQVVSVSFVTIEAREASGKVVQGGDIYAAEMNQADATFELPGPDRRGIPPGKYRVAVTQKWRREAFDAIKKKTPRSRTRKSLGREADTLENRFGPSSSPIIVQVDRSDVVTIDLDRPGEAARR